jgi:hypothetical protein
MTSQGGQAVGMTDLVEFVLARIADDEQEARKAGADAMVGWRWKHYSREAYEEIQALVLVRSARVLAECAAKRRMLALLDEYSDRAPHVPRLTIYTRDVIPKILALPYADHPDYDESWRP